MNINKAFKSSVVFIKKKDRHWSHCWSHLVCSLREAGARCCRCLRDCDYGNNGTADSRPENLHI